MTPHAAAPVCVLVRGLPDGRTALARWPAVTLLSVPAAASFGGAAVWRALVDALRLEWPAHPFTDILDCGDAPGRALEALRLGQRVLVFDGAEPVRRALVERARPLGATILPTRPPALDLARLGRADL